mgnify:CR=1 FL=1
MLTKSEFFTKFTTVLPGSNCSSSYIYFTPISMGSLEEMHAYSVKERFCEYYEFAAFEDIKEKTGRSESDVIKIMRKNLSDSSFRLWRKRTHNQSTKHRKKFENSRKQLNQRIYFSDDD